MLIEALHPGIYAKGEDVEPFIVKCTRYFDASGIHKAMRGILVIGLIERNIREKYENTDATGCKGFEDKLRRAFARKQSMAQDMGEALNYRRSNEDADSYERKIDLLLDHLLQYKWDRESIKRELLLHCCNDPELRREIKMKDIEHPQDIVKTIRKFDAVREETEQVSTVRSYRDAVKGQTVGNRRQNGWGDGNRAGRNVQNEVRNEITCWTCNEKGHLSRNCYKKQVKECYECGSKGHLRRECNRVRCFKCNNLGHISTECRSAGNREIQNQWRASNEQKSRYRPYDSKGYQERRPTNRQVNAIRDEEGRSYGTGSRTQGKDRSGGEVPEEYDPNELAPSEVEMMGAIN
jgi:cellular nucleic acid-binding protein